GTHSRATLPPPPQECGGSLARLLSGATTFLSSGGRIAHEQCLRHALTGYAATTTTGMWWLLSATPVRSDDIPVVGWQDRP
ncbi:MAG: hypothetical protein NTW21_34765, partial [Verrucomicrobia bacterium]|nr:hypothetical protein [Verrucomicrobiota bacterium]